jgi:hypothetical protein
LEEEMMLMLIGIGGGVGEGSLRRWVLFRRGGYNEIVGGNFDEVRKKRRSRCELTCKGEGWMGCYWVFSDL